MTEHAGIAGPGGASRPGLARLPLISVLGITQILAWGSSYYLPAVLAAPIVKDTGWSLPWVVGGLSVGLLVAGVVSPRVGRAIDRHGGRPVLAVSAVLLAVGLAALGLSPNLPIYLMAWVIIGAGMGAGLYDAAFGTLGRYYGESARGAVATLTLFGGFASTVCWPLSTWLVATFGWREACLAYAALHLLVVLPAYLALLPHAERGAHVFADHERHETAEPGAGIRHPAFLILATIITIASAVTAVVSVHLLAILEARGATLAAAVALGALIGPSQVGARAIEMALGRFYHPTWTMIAAMTLMAAGLSLLALELPLSAVALLLYGAGIGIKSIARGTVPLVLFGPERYASVIGRLAMPSLVAQALAPFLAALVLAQWGSTAAIWLLVMLSAASLALAISLTRLSWLARGDAK
jgi:predicted MFS family arabinose efflux permease